MSKRIIFFLLSFLLTSGLYGESPAMQAYLQRFIRADLIGKANILYEASSNRDLVSTSLYNYALQFVIDNYAQIDELRDMNSLINVSINGLINEKNAGNIDSSQMDNILDNLWVLAINYPDPAVRGEIIIDLSSLGKGKSNTTEKLNNYLSEIIKSYLAGEQVDYSIVSACITAIMQLGDSSSYRVLFSVICSGFPEVIAYESYGALEMIPGNLSRFLISIIENNPTNEKYAAFRIVMNSKKLSVSEKGQLAEIALSQSLIAGENNADLSVMRYDAVQMLTYLRWTRASALAIRHYYMAQADYNQNIIPKERFLEAIACLGAVGNSDAALWLGLQLGLINTRTETTGSFDAEITMAIVQSLGLIGDNAAFNHLSYVTNLPYTEGIIAEAKAAIARLKW